ncbi:MFS transporter [Aspergillus heteromorphus CBS 117.55]|uniref:MFS transporter n=1 Tax=Aspergillus heteromorphus CBS 117.55 TaxID=1448321 RepID=A0A317V928_9EURO|nr:MFS transporter [Aspergillus heteromorphus CBS 117.55]PWY69497.1 MFS transporter [Aspergillus heteromorphus CBS 117.55]
MSPDETTQLLPSSDGAQPSDSADDTSSDYGNARTRLAIFIAYLGAFLASSDESLVIATYDIIASEFHELSKASWLVTGYNLGYCVALPVYSTLADICGRKTSMLMGYLLFGLGCLICSLSGSMVNLIAGRIISGAGSAGMVVMISIMITDLAAPSDVALLRSYTNVVNMTGRGVGAVLGSMMVNSFGWRWAFAGRIPFILLCLLLSRVQFPTKQAESTVPELSAVNKFKRLDFFGIASFAAAIFTLLLSLTTAGMVDGKLSHVYILLGVCIFSTVVFACHEVLWAKKPLMPLRLVTQGVGQYWLVQVVLFSGRNAVVATITQYMAQVKKVPEATGSTFLVLCTMGLATGSIISGLSIKRTKRYKKMSIISIVVSIVSSTFLFLSWHFDRPVLESLVVIPMSLPIGIVISGEFIGMSSRAPPEDLAASVGAYYLSQQLGVILGASLGPLLVRMGFMHDIAGKLGDRTPEIVRHVLSDARYVETLPQSMQEIVRSSLQYGYQFIPVLATVTAALCVPSLILTREERVE